MDLDADGQLAVVDVVTRLDGASLLRLQYQMQAIAGARLSSEETGNAILWLLYV